MDEKRAAELAIAAEDAFNKRQIYEGYLMANVPRDPDEASRESEAAKSQERNSYLKIIEEAVRSSPFGSGSAAKSREALLRRQSDLNA